MSRQQQELRLRSNDVEGIEGSGGAESQQCQWACPFFKFDPIKYAECRFRKMRSVSDVRQHMKRKHLDELKGNLKDAGNRRSKTHEGRWNDIWSEQFPDVKPPATPYYIGEAVAELSELAMRDYIGQHDDLSGDVKKRLEEFSTYVKARSLARRSEDLSGHGVASVSQHQAADISVQDATHHDFPLPANPFPLIGNIGSAIWPGPQPDNAGCHHVQPLAMMTEWKDASSFNANSQNWASVGVFESYPPTSANQHFSSQAVAVGAVNGYAYAIPSTPMDDLDWTGVHSLGSHGVD